MESTLSLQKSDLESEIGIFLGFGGGTNAGDTAWSTSQQAAITRIRKSGERQFYYPPVVEGQAGVYDWSFLKPVLTLQLDSGSSTMDLPDDFGGFEGRLVISDGTNNGSFWPVDLTGVGRVLQEQARYPTATGRPQLAAEQWIKGTSLAGGQRAQVIFYPITDQAYTIKFQYYLQPAALSDSFPYCYGGGMHAETILESCLAIAEQRLDDAGAIHSAKFQERLMASIALDRKNKPQWLGYNGDRSDWGWNDWFDRRQQTNVTFNGVQY